MTRVLAYTSPARGHLFPITPILDELRESGHHVSVRTLASERELMTSRGFEFAPINSTIEELVAVDWKAKGSQGKLKSSVHTFTQRAPLDAADLAASIDETNPDVVLVDTNSWGAVAAAEKWGGPWAMFCPYPLALRSRGVPPFGPGLAPARGPAGRVRDALLRPVVMGAVGRIMVPGVNRVRAEIGIPAISGTDELYTRPPLVLYMTAPPFEYERPDLPANIVMVGPCEWEPPSEPPAWLSAVDKPLVLVTTSSEFQNDQHLVSTALDALRDEDVFVVATVPAGDATHFDVPANARVERFLTHGPLLERAVAVVTHGGMGATQKALARGVPVCAVPFGRDQFEVARRVEVASAGTRLPGRRLNAARLRDSVRAAMTMTDGAARVAAGYRATGGPKRAAQEIERLAQSHA